MRFIGQKHIMNVLAFVLPELYRNPGMGNNFLFVGPSGYGKTTLALDICNFLANDLFEMYLADDKPFALKRRVIFIDEVHRIKLHELLYPHMDSKNHVFVFASNLSGNLPEAFRNRCDEFNFSEYSDDELILMTLEQSTFKISTENALKIVDAGQRNPRIIGKLMVNLGLYFSNHPELDTSKVDFSEILENVFLIEDGLDVACRNYIDVLERVGKRASLTLLKNLLHFDTETITNRIEPVLLRKGLIIITSKGRILL